MANVVSFQDADFDTQIFPSEIPVLIEFTAAWCPPCRAMAPHVEAIAQQYAGRVTVGTVNTDQNQQMSQRLGVRALPTTIVFKGGRPVSSVVGAVSRQKLEQLLLPHLAGASDVPAHR